MSTTQSNATRRAAPVPRRALVIGLIFAAASISGTMLRPTKLLADALPAVDLERMIPRQFDDWQLVAKNSVVAVDPNVQRNLDNTYDQLLSRTYRNSKGQEILLSIAYGREQTHELKAHRQEVCYRAQGFTIKFAQPAKVVIKNTPMPVTRMFAVRAERSEPVTYWFTMGDKVLYSISERLGAGILYSFYGKIPDGFLVRVSSIADDPKSAFDIQDAFSRQLLASVSPDVRMRLSGT
jgi:EpsI family protein